MTTYCLTDSRIWDAIRFLFLTLNASMLLILSFGLAIVVWKGFISRKITVAVLLLTSLGLFLSKTTVDGWHIFSTIKTDGKEMHLINALGYDFKVLPVSEIKSKWMGRLKPSPRFPSHNTCVLFIEMTDGSKWESVRSSCTLMGKFLY